MKIKNGIVSLFVLFIISCDNPLTQDVDLHCIVDYNGFYDDCNICSGGSSGHIANSEKDCNDECGGISVIDVCGVCDGDNTTCDSENCIDIDSDEICDPPYLGDNCVGQYDACGVCEGDNATCDPKNCKDTDNDGICDDPGNNDYPGDNCVGQYDACGVCEGDDSTCNPEECSYTLDDDGICDPPDGDACVGEYDECGICNGYNSDKDLCGICFGYNNSCDVGLITLAEWYFSEMHFWNNSDCNGFPYSSFYNYICIEESCYDYELDFYIDPNDGYFRFSQINKTWGISSPENITENSVNGVWTFENSTLCLDYEYIELEDDCYEIVEFENTFFDCETNINNCIDNIVNFSNMNNIEDTCSKEKFDTINNESTINSSNNIPIENFTTTFKNLLISLNYFSN